MIFKKNKISFLILLIAVVFSLPLVSRALEIDFPAFSGPGCPDGGCKPGDSFGPSDWIRYIFVFSFAAVSLAMIGSITYAGVKYVTAGDNAGQVSDAKKRIWNSFLGLVILLGSYLFLQTINPQLVSIRDPNINIQIEGVWRDYYKFDPPGTKILGEACEIDLECFSKSCSFGKCSRVSPNSIPTEPQENQPL